MILTEVGIVLLRSASKVSSYKVAIDAFVILFADIWKSCRVMACSASSFSCLMIAVSAHWLPPCTSDKNAAEFFDRLQRPSSSSNRDDPC